MWVPALNVPTPLIKEFEQDETENEVKKLQVMYISMWIYFGLGTSTEKAEVWWKQVWMNAFWFLKQAQYVYISAELVPLKCNTEKDKGRSRQRTAGMYKT